MSKADPNRPQRAQDPSPALLPPLADDALLPQPAPPLSVLPPAPGQAAPPTFSGPPTRLEPTSPMAPFVPQPMAPFIAAPAVPPVPKPVAPAGRAGGAPPIGPPDQTPPRNRWQGTPSGSAPLAQRAGATVATAAPAVSAPPGTPAPASLAPPAEDVPPSLTESALHHAPPFLVSMFVHMALLIVLALVTFRREIVQQLQLSAVYSDRAGEQLLDDRLQSPEVLETTLESPLVAIDVLPVNDPLAAPPPLPENVLDPSRAAPNIEAPSIGMALTGREAGNKQLLLQAYGGTPSTEAAVVAGLEWLKRQQRSDGGWSLVGPYPDRAAIENRCSATAMALLAFQGYGVKHVPDSSITPDFHDVVRRGWDFLLKMQNKDGFFVHEGGHQQRLYAQAQATIALCEVYGMTKDERFKRPAQLALDFAHKAQSPELGGWRYEPREDSDLSVTGWCVMALQSGLMAGLEVQSPNLDLIRKFLDSVSLEDGAQYCYQPGREASLTMTAEGLLCRQYLGWRRDDPRMRAGIDLILAQPISYQDQNVYYWYYATQACHHMDGADWNRWNAVMRLAIPAAQTKTGPDRGSWNPSGDRWGAHGGRLYVTCLSLYMLESYYRHLPIYQWRLK